MTHCNLSVNRSLKVAGGHFRSDSVSAATARSTLNAKVSGSGCLSDFSQDRTPL